MRGAAPHRAGRAVRARRATRLRRRDLHFAIGNRAASSSATPVADRRPRALDRWQALWDAAGIHPDAAYAESLADPVRAERAARCCSTRARCTSPRRRGCRTRSTPSRLPPRSNSRSGEPTEAGEHVTFYVATRRLRGAQGHDRGPAGAHRHAAGQAAARRRAAPARRAGAGRQPINLLQGAYAAPSSFGSQLQQWRLPAALAAATLVAFIGVQGFKLWQLHAAEKQLDAQIAADLQPDPARATDRRSARPDPGRAGPRRRRQRCPAARDLAAGAGHRAVAGRARRSASASAAGVLELRLVAPTVEALDGIKQAMSRDGAHGRTAVGEAARPAGRRPPASPPGGRMNVRDWFDNLSERERNLVYAAGALVGVALALPGARAAVPDVGQADGLARRAEDGRPRVDAGSRRRKPWPRRAWRRPAAAANRWSCWSTARRARPDSATRSATRARTATTACACASKARSFDALVTWLASLQQQYGVSIESATVGARRARPRQRDAEPEARRRSGLIALRSQRRPECSCRDTTHRLADRARRAGAARLRARHAARRHRRRPAAHGGHRSRRVRRLDLVGTRHALSWRGAADRRCRMEDCAGTAARRAASPVTPGSRAPMVRSRRTSTCRSPVATSNCGRPASRCRSRR